MAVEQHHHPDLGRCWLILFCPDARSFFVERNGEWLADFAALHDARAAVYADVRAYTEER